MARLAVTGESLNQTELLRQSGRLTMKWKMSYSRPEVAHTQGMADTIRLGTTIRAHLKAKGFSLKWVSAQTGIPYSTLHTWLENRQPKDILKVKKLADFLGVGLHELLFGEGDAGLVATAEVPVLPSSDGLEGVYEVTIRRRDREP